MHYFKPECIVGGVVGGMAGSGIALAFTEHQPLWLGLTVPLLLFVVGQLIGLWKLR